MRPLVFLIAVGLHAQSTAPPLEFEVASIKPAPPLVENTKIGVHIDGALVTCNSFALRDYITMAYRVKMYQVVAPEWVGSQRFDIRAKLSAPLKDRDQLPGMFQALLADRFHLQLHHESRQLPVYALIAAKGGLKLKESPPDTGTDAAKAGTVDVNASGSRNGTTVDFGRGSYFNFGGNRFEARKITMPSLADMLARFVDRPVVDMTDAAGVYDFKLEVSPEDYQAMMIRGAIAAGVNLPPQALRALDNSSGDSLGAALQTVGLKLDPRKAPIDVLVIDRVDKTPTEN